MNAQQDYWLLGDTRVSFEPFSTAASPVPSPPDIYTAENAVHDENGDLIFSVRTDVNNLVVFDANGNQVYSLNNNYFSCTDNELAILPLPGHCNQYCVFFFNYSSFVENQLFMLEIIIDENGIASVGNNEFVGSEGGGNSQILGNALAVSPVISGTDASRYLYTASDGGDLVQRRSLTESGLSGPQTLVNFNTNSTTEINEMDLSPDESFLIYTKYESLAVVEVLLGEPQSNLTDLEAFLHGVEVRIEDGKSIVYVSHATRGLIRTQFDLDNFEFSDFEDVPGGADFTNTHIEQGPDGNLYLVNPKGKLHFVTPDLQIGATDVTVLSRSGSCTEGPQNTFALPDQVDGESYELFNGVQEISFDDITINGTTLPEMIGDATQLPLFYDCSELLLELENSTGDPDNFYITIQNVESEAGLPLPCEPYLCYTSNNLASQYPLLPLDLRCLESPGCDLFEGFTQYKYFRVEIEYRKGRCEMNSRVAYFRMGDEPTPVSIGLAVNSSQPGGNDTPPATVIGDAVGIGVYSGSIELDNSAGDITTVSIEIDEVNCATGATIQSLTVEPFAVASQADLQDIALNGLTVEGTQGFFGNNANFWFGRCLRLTATVSNQCGSASAFSFLTFDSFSLQDDETSGRSKPGTTNFYTDEIRISVYPNPVKDRLNIEIPQVDRIALLRIFDPTGRELFARSAFTETTLSLSLADWPGGVYTLRIEGEGLSKTTRFIKE